MQLTGNKTLQARLTIRVSKNTLSFSVVDREAEHQVIYEPYTVKRTLTCSISTPLPVIIPTPSSTVFSRLST